MDWQPIETAPEGQIVIAYSQAWYGEVSHFNGGNFTAIAVAGDDTDADAVREGFVGPWWRELGGDTYATWVKPTHWMPLPGPPPSDGG